MRYLRNFVVGIYWYVVSPAIKNIVMPFEPWNCNQCGAEICQYVSSVRLTEPALQDYFERFARALCGAPNSQECYNDGKLVVLELGVKSIVPGDNITW